LDEPKPPWIAISGLDPEDPATQGIAEAYIALEWLPFWQSLAPGEKAAYLDRWQTSTAWREAIALRYDADEDALAQEARDHAASEIARRRRPWWRFWA
jgi:hypothetical protein